MSNWNTFTNDRQFDGGVRRRYFQRANYLQSNGPGLLFQRVGNNIDVKKRQLLYDTYEAAAGLLEETAEGAGEAKLFIPRKIGERTIIVRTKKLGLKVTRELQDDDLYGYVEKHTPRLTDFTMRTIEQDFVNTFINTAFTYDAYRDQRDNFGVALSIPLASTTHRAGISGKTYSNTSTNVALSEASLAAAAYSWTGMLDDGGLVVPFVPTKFLLLVHGTMMAKAQQIVRSTSVINSIAGTLNSGVAKQGGEFQFQVSYTPYQTNVLQWTLIPLDFDTENEGGWDIVFRDKPVIESKTNQDPDWKKWIARTSYSNIAGSARAAYFNQGA